MCIRDRVSSGLGLLALDAATTFRLDDAGRILRENDLDASPGPRAFIAGCAAGNLVHVRVDIAASVAAEIAALVAAEPPWIDPGASPGCVGQVARLLGLPADCGEVGFNYALPPREAAPGVRFVCCDTGEGDRLLAALRRDGVPAHLLAAGFASVEDFWAPWCVAIEDGVIAAIAFAARLAPRSAAVGVYAFPGYRGRGLAASVTARWTGLTALADHALFYGTSAANVSSQRVAARLGLPRIGLGLRLA